MNQANGDIDSESTSVTLADSTQSQDAESYIQKILFLYKSLSKQTDLQPCASINALFGELVGLCTLTLSKELTKAIMEDPRIEEVLPQLRSICSEAECHLESYWAELISNGANPQEVLKSFPYHTNYTDLTRLELAALHAVDPTPPKSIAFIGSGPLPLTSLCLLDQLTTSAPKSLFKTLLSYLPSFLYTPTPPLQILNIDSNPLAITQSQRLCRHLSTPPTQMSFLHASASSIPPLPHDLIYLAALVGSTQVEKEELLIHICSRLRRSSLILIRTSWGLRGLLYPEFDVTSERVREVVEVCVVVHPYGAVVNSVVVGRVR